MEEKLMQDRLDACGEARAQGRRLSVFEEDIKREMAEMVKPGQNSVTVDGTRYRAIYTPSVGMFILEPLPERREVEIEFRNQAVRLIVSKRPESQSFHVHEVLGDEYLRALESVVEFGCQREIAEAWDAAVEVAA